jgi:hypothetical protein
MYTNSVKNICKGQRDVETTTSRWKKKTNKTNSVALSPQATYNDWSTSRWKKTSFKYAEHRRGLVEPYL